jgi:hypothetical protein
MSRSTSCDLRPWDLPLKLIDIDGLIIRTWTRLSKPYSVGFFLGMEITRLGFGMTRDVRAASIGWRSQLPPRDRGEPKGGRRPSPASKVTTRGGEKKDCRAISALLLHSLANKLGLNKVKVE